MVAQRLDEQYPDFYASFVTILPHFDWQIELLEEWMKGCPYVKKQGGTFIAAGLSEADEERLDYYCIEYEPVPYAVTSVDGTQIDVANNTALSTNLFPTLLL